MRDGADSLGTQAWWEMPTDDPQTTSTIHGVVTGLLAVDAGRRNRYRIWDDLYEGLQSLSIDGSAASSRDVQGSTDMIDGTTFNYAARALDMVHSKITAEMPTVRAVGHGADYDQHLRAQALSRFIVGLTEALSLGTNLPVSVQCALRTGTGAAVSLVRDGEPTIEIAHPRELLVDPDDAVHGDPRCLYRICPKDRRSVLRDHPDHVEAIRAAGTITDRDAPRSDDWTRGSSSRHVSDCVDVIDAWILGAPDSPGRHVRCLDNGVPLVDEPWESPRFPVSFLRAWEPAAGSGFWGHGLMERLAQPQLIVNELLLHAARQTQHSNLYMWLPDTADIAEGALADHEPAGVTVIRTSGAGTPQFQIPPVIGSEIFTILDRYKADIYAMAGTDESAVGSQSPLGRDASGVAIRTYHDFQSQGHVDVMKRIGRFVVDVIERTIDVAKAHFGPTPDGPSDDDDDSESQDLDSQGSWEVRHPTLDVIRWSEVDMDRDAYVLELEESSPVPDTMAGAIQEIEEDAASGLIPPEYLTRLREDPDLWWMERCNAKEDVEFTDWVIQELMDPRKPIPQLPDEIDPDMLGQRLRREILASIRLSRPPIVVDRLRRYALELSQSLTPPAPPQPPAGPQMPGQAPGAPMPMGPDQGGAPPQ